MIDMSWLRGEGFFEGDAGKLWTASFTREGNPDGAVSYWRMDDARLPSRLVFEYNAQQQGGPWRALNYTVPIVQTCCHFGGLRHWFICPLVINGRPCERVCRCLYLSGNAEYFGCRECHRLTYQSRVLHRADGWESYGKHRVCVKRAQSKFKTPRGRKAKERRKHRLEIAHREMWRWEESWDEQRARIRAYDR